MEDMQIKKSLGGRPLQAIKKEYKISVRFSRQEYFILKEKAKEAGIKPSVFIRQAVIKAIIISRISAEEMKYYRELSGMSSNINQMTRIANREGLFAAMQYFQQYRERFDYALQKLKS